MYPGERQRRKREEDRQREEIKWVRGRERGK
jgi:hypothetical protein